MAASLNPRIRAAPATLSSVRSTSSAASSGAAGGVQGTARLLGQTAGSVIMALLFSLAPLDAAPRIGLAVGTLLALVGGLVSAMRIGAHAQMTGPVVS